MILSFSFSGGEGGEVRFKNKFVRTKGFVDEQVGVRGGGVCGGEAATGQAGLCSLTHGPASVQSTPPPHPRPRKPSLRLSFRLRPPPPAPHPAARPRAARCTAPRSAAAPPTATPSSTPSIST
jgi:hypothetical protein